MWLFSRKPIQTRMIVAHNDADESTYDTTIYVYSKTSKTWIKRATHRSIAKEKLKRHVDAEIARTTHASDIELMYVLPTLHDGDKNHYAIELLAYKQETTHDKNYLNLQPLSLNTNAYKTIAAIAGHAGIQLHNSTAATWQTLQQTHTGKTSNTKNDENLSWVDRLPEQINTKDFPTNAVRLSTMEYIALTKRAALPENNSGATTRLTMRPILIRLGLEKHLLYALFTIGLFTGCIAGFAHVLTINHRANASLEAVHSEFFNLKAENKTASSATWQAWVQQMKATNEWLGRQNTHNLMTNKAMYLQFYVVNNSIQTTFVLNKEVAKDLNFNPPKGCSLQEIIDERLSATHIRNNVLECTTRQLKNKSH